MEVGRVIVLAGDSCNDDCLHAKFEALERMQLRLNSSLEPVGVALRTVGHWLGLGH